MHKQVPQMEYFFCNTHKELPETYEYLHQGLAWESNISVLIADLTTGWMSMVDSALAQDALVYQADEDYSLEQFVGFRRGDYIGIRADENREGYISTKPNITCFFHSGTLVKADIIRLLEEKVGLDHHYYRWRSRSGCFFCFFQRKYRMGNAGARTSQAI